MNVWKLVCIKAALECIWKHGKTPPKGSKHYYSCPPIPAHLHLLRRKAKRGERQTGFQRVLLHLTPLLGALSGPSPVLLLFPTSLLEGLPSLTICSKAPSDLPALSGTWSIRCSLAACIRVCAWPHRYRLSRGDGPGCPFESWQLSSALLHARCVVLFLSKH